VTGVGAVAAIPRATLVLGAGRMAARPVLLPEDRYVMGRVLHSGTGGQPRLSVRRTRVSAPDPDGALTWGGSEACVARLNLIDVPANEIRQGRGLIRLPPRAAMETSLRNVREPCVWAMAHAVDQITFDLPREAVAAWAQDHGVGRGLLPDGVSGSSMADAVLKAFGLAVLPLLEAEAGGASQFFVDHILDGVCAYLFRSFSAGPGLSRGGLAPWQVRRAKEMMEAGCKHDLALPDVAAACGLSVAHFSRAFRQSCGTTPYRWLMARRVEKAQALLRFTDMPLATIAAECGFTDQAHLTNVLSKRLGAPPGALRRFWRSEALAPPG
jgi:AraC family transcriptional regulator